MSEKKKAVSYENVVKGKLKLKGDIQITKNGVKKVAKKKDIVSKEEKLKEVYEKVTKTESEIRFEKVQKERVFFKL